MDEQEEKPTTAQPASGSDSSVNDYRKHLWDALRAGQEQYDKYLLTLSSGGLAISLTLIKDIFGKSKLACPTVLVVSWVLFCLSIVATLASFLTSQKSLRKHLCNYEEYIATGNDEKLKTPNPIEMLTNFLNYASGSCFFIAVVATIIFASINVERSGIMSKDKLEDLQKGYSAPQAPRHQTNDGYTPPPAPTQQQQQPKPDTTTTKK